MNNSSERPFFAYRQNGPELPRVERAERVVSLSLAATNELRQLFPVDKIVEKPNLLNYFAANRAAAERHFEGHPTTTTEHVPAAMYQLGRAQAYDLYLRAENNVNQIDHKERQILAIQRNIASAEAQQHMVAALFQEEDPNVLAELVHGYGLARVTPWLIDLSQAYDDSKVGVQLPPERYRTYINACRGLAGHAAAIRLLEHVGQENESGITLFSSIASLDAAYGIDVVGAPSKPNNADICWAYQVKASADSHTGVIIAEHPSRPVNPYNSPRPKSLTAEQLADYKAERALRAFQYGLHKLNAMTGVSRSLKGLFVTLRGANFDVDWEALQKSGTSAFDSHTGLCNAAMREAAAKVLAPHLQSTGTSFRKRSPRPNALHRDRRDHRKK